MIGKVPRPGKGFKGVVEYLTKGARNDPKGKDRVSWAETRNLLIRNIEDAPKVMRATANKSKRVERPVYHYVISWSHQENPSDEMMRRVADTTCKDLGLEEYQALYIAHHDTRHRHVHVVVNRIHPETGKAWRRDQDYSRIELSLRRQSEAMGLDYVPGRFNDPDKFKGQPKRARDGDMQRALRNGKPMPRDRWSKEQISALRPGLAEIFSKSKSWEELDRALDAVGLEMSAKGQGMEIGDDAGAMKLSDVSRETRLKSLELRFGAPFASFERARKVQAPVAENVAASDGEDDRASLERAQGEAELAFILHGAGLVTRKQLARSVRERDVAREKLAADQDLLDKIGAESVRALKPRPGEISEGSGRLRSKKKKKQPSLDR